MKKKVTKFSSTLTHGDEVDFRIGNDDTYRGTISAIRFTKAKVFYDIVDDYSGKVKKNIDSCDIIFKN